jgi:hypothetical protein
VLVGRLALLNIVLGVVVSATLDLEKVRLNNLQDQRAEAEAKVLQVLREFFTAMDLDGSGSVGRDELRQAFNVPAIAKALAQLELPVNDPDALFSILDASGDGELTFTEFIEGCMRLRKRAGAVDVMKLRLHLNSSEQRGDDYVDKMGALSRRVKGLDHQLQVLFKELKGYVGRCSDKVVVRRRGGLIRHATSTLPPRGGLM